MTPRKRAKLILNKLSKLYPDAKIALQFSNNFELLVAVMLSAQTTDLQVNKVTKNLFSKYGRKAEKKEIENFANVDLKELEEDIRSIGLFKTKARNIKKAAEIILYKYNGQVPKTMAELLSLPGVGRKTANVVLSHAFNINAGIAVDTHVKRLSKELGFSKSLNPVIIERDLMTLFDKKDWRQVTTLLIAHGRGKLILDLGKID